MGKNIFETFMGAVVLLVAISFTIIVYKSGNITTENGYDIMAKFNKIDGLAIGSDVRISGIKVGSVTAQKIDPDTYLAIVKMNIDKGIKIPSDSSAEIVSNGLLGGKYMSLVPGGDEKMLDDGGEIKFTQSSINIEGMIGKFMFGGTDEKKDDSAKNIDDIF